MTRQSNRRAAFPAPPLRVPCPSCGAAAAAPCLNAEGDPLSRWFAHRERGAAYRAWVPEDPWAADSGLSDQAATDHPKAAPAGQGRAE